MNTGTIRNLGITELQDYIYCSKMHEFRWLKNTPLFSVRAKHYWSDTLIQTWLEYCKAWISSKSHDLDYLKELWQKYWVKERLAIDWTGTKQNEDTAHYLAEGWTILVQAHKYFSSLYSVPAAVNMPYFLDINNQRLTGNIDLLFYADQNQQAVVAYKLSKSLYNASRMMGFNNPEITAWYAYLNKITASSSLVAPTIRYYILETTKQHVIQTTRNEKQIETLEETITSVANAIENKIVIPDYGFKCTNCEYRKMCNKSNYVYNTAEDEK